VNKSTSTAIGQGSFSTWQFGRGSMLALLILLPLLVYSNSLFTPFHYDDFHSIVENPHIRRLANIPLFFGSGGDGYFSTDPAVRMYRPLLLAGYAVNYAISGYQVWSYHLVSLGLHLTCVLLVFALGQRLGLKREVAFGAALLFGVHPVNTETVNYISSRSELMATAAMLAGAWTYFFCPFGWGRRLAVWTALLLGLAAKAIAVVLPVLLLVYSVRWRRRFDPLLWAGLFLGCGSYVYWIGTALQQAVHVRPVRPWDEQIWTQVKAVVFYLKLLIWPRGLNVDHQFQVSDTPFELYAGSALLFIVSLSLWLAWRRWQYPLAFWSWLAFGVALAPTALVPLNVLVNEHRLYLPSAIFLLGMGAIIQHEWQRWLEWRWAILLVFVAVILGCSVATFQRNRVWASPLTLWEDAVVKAPQLARPRMFLAEAYEKAGRTGQALGMWRQVLHLDPSFAPAYAHVSRLYRQQGDLGEAIEVLRLGIGLMEDGAVAFAELALLYRQAAENGRQEDYIGLMRQSAVAYQRALAAAPEDGGLLNNLGNTYQVLGQHAEALPLHEKALALGPRQPHTWVNAGNALLGLGRLSEAERHFAQALQIQPNYIGAWLSIGGLRERLGQKAAAIDAYERAASIDPAYRAMADQRRRYLEGDGNGP
jgi:protein O-mannosyl-transferase